MSTYLELTCKLQIWKGNFAEIIYKLQLINGWLVGEKFTGCQSSLHDELPL